MSLIRLLLVDDNWEFLIAAQNYLQNQENLQVVGLANSGEAALQMVAALQPDLMLVDLAMPRLSGLEVIRRIKTDYPTIRLILLTLHDLPEYRLAAADVGADGFVSKAQLYEQLLPAIEQTQVT